MLNLTEQDVQAAVRGYQEQIRLIDVQMERIRRQLEGKPVATGRNIDPPPVKPKRQISAAGRKAISLAQKKRWAAKKAA